MSEARDAARYRWLRERMNIRDQQSMAGSTRPGLEVRIGCSYFDSELPQSMNPDYWRAQHKKLDAAIDDAIKHTASAVTQQRSEK